MGFDDIRPEAYGESFAEVYDRWYQGVTDAEATADFVAARARPGPVLELGVGTGRLARPLARRGRAVIGLDASAAMLGRCAEGGSHEPRGGELHLVRADMACLPFRAGIGTALLAFNTLFNLPSATRQQQAFDSLASALIDGGRVIIEALDLSALAAVAGRATAVRDVADGVVTVIGTGVDADSQVIEGQHTEIGDDGLVVRPWVLRWVAPGEIDRFADRAGFDLVERVAGWNGDRYQPGADQHISVYDRRRR